MGAWSFDQMGIRDGTEEFGSDRESVLLSAIVESFHVVALLAVAS